MYMIKKRIKFPEKNIIVQTLQCGLKNRVFFLL